MATKQEEVVQLSAAMIVMTLPARAGIKLAQRFLARTTLWKHERIGRPDGYCVIR